MSETTIGEVTARQFERVWNSLRDALSKMSEQQYRSSDCEWLTPMRLAYHIVETAEYYSLKSEEDGGESFDWDNGPIEQLLSKDKLLEYLEQVQLAVFEWLTNTSNDQFLLSEVGFNNTGGTRLDRAIYSLRHAQHHLGQINAELRRRGLERGEWG